jgi:hypothetical protein
VDSEEVMDLPGYDGTGPRGEGPMTGRGEGHCLLWLDRAGRVTGGFAGIRGQPFVLRPVARRALAAMVYGWRKWTADRDRHIDIT